MEDTFLEGTLGLPHALHCLEWPLVGHSPTTLGHTILSDPRLRRHHPDVTRISPHPSRDEFPSLLESREDNNCIHFLRRFEGE